MHHFYPDLLSLPLPNTAPPVVFLDAVGTLFGVRDGVGGIYRQFATRYGVDSEAGAIDRAFYQAFKSADSSIFAGAEPTTIPALEYAWWQEINRQTFLALDVLDRFTDFEAFFAELYAYFATAEAWYLYPDTLPALERWRDRGWNLAVLSNFDTRLYKVLDALELRPFFSSVTISTEVGAAKPSPIVFQQALATQQVTIAQQPWHIGDSELEDYRGATEAGLQAWLLKRL
jgi:putative hydrolase of the HAD superfamily